DAEDVVAKRRKRAAEVDRAGGLADATLLVRDRDDLTQPRSPLRGPHAPGPLRVAVLPTARGSARATSPARTITASARLLGVPQRRSLAGPSSLRCVSKLADAPPRPDRFATGPSSLRCVNELP